MAAYSVVTAFTRRPLWRGRFFRKSSAGGKEASCQAAVARVVSYCELEGLDSPTEDAGDYCKARAKLSEAALRDLSCERGRGTRTNGRPALGCGKTSIKSNLHLGHVRCKSPEMVRRELWTMILGYHLIRTTAAGAALLHDKQPRQISFTGACQYVLASWMQLSSGFISASRLADYLRVMLKQLAGCEVANRPGRLEPRVLKRRRHGYKLMQKSRNELRRELRQHCT